MDSPRFKDMAILVPSNVTNKVDPFNPISEDFIVRKVRKVKTIFEIFVGPHFSVRSSSIKLFVYSCETLTLYGNDWSVT